MAAGDIRFKVVQVTLHLGERIVVEYRYGVEAKDGTVDGRGETWTKEWSTLSAAQKDGLNTLVGDLRGELKVKVAKLTDALALQ